MERTKAFSDGVLAIVITILVLGLEVPDHNFSEDKLMSFLGKINETLHPYFGSFILVACYWLQHTIIFHYITRGNRIVVWLNLLFLFCISPLPFLTQLRADYPQEIAVATMFGGAQILCGGSLLLLWLYATAPGRGHSDAKLEKSTITSMGKRIALGSAVATVGSLVTVIQPYVGTLILATTPLCYLSHRTVDGG